MSRSSPLARVPLVAVLAAVTFFELVLNRIVGAQLRFSALAPRSPLLRGFDALGLFAFELVSMLAILVLAAALVRLTVFASQYRAVERVALGLTGGVCLALCAVGALVRLPPRLEFHLHLSFCFLALLAVFTILAQESRLGVKLGALLLLVPTLLHFFLLVSRRALPFELGLNPLQLAAMMQTAVAAAAISALAFSAGRKPHGTAWGVSAVVLVFGLALSRLDWETGARIAAYGFGLDLPFTPAVQALYVIALTAFVFSVLRLLADPGPDRLRGYGLILLGFSGFTLELPYQVAIAAIGLLCLVEASVREGGVAVPREAFEQMMRARAQVLGTTQVTMTGRAGAEVARLSATAPSAAAVALTVSRRRGRVRGVEVTVADPAPREPPFTLERRGQPRLGPRSDGPRVRTNDEVFDREFVIHDRRGVGAPLLDDEMRARMLSVLAGWLGVWPQRGVQYQATALPPSDEGLAALIQLLVEVAARSA